MNALAYFILAGLVTIFTGLRVRNERQKHKRYKQYLDMNVDILFQEPTDPYDYMRRGSVMLRLHKCDDNIKGFVIKEVSFSDRAFYVPIFDNLYFKRNNDKSQLLSTSFRIRRHNLRRLDGKQLYITIGGWISENDGKTKPFKTKVPFTVQANQHIDDTTISENSLVS